MTDMSKGLVQKVSSSSERRVDSYVATAIAVAVAIDVAIDVAVVEKSKF